MLGERASRGRVDSVDARRLAATPSGPAPKLGTNKTFVDEERATDVTAHRLEHDVVTARGAFEDRPAIDGEHGSAPIRSTLAEQLVGGEARLAARFITEVHRVPRVDAPTAARARDRRSARGDRRRGRARCAHG